MRKITSGFLLAVLCLSFTGIDNPEMQVKKAADKDMPAMLALIPAGQEAEYGFSSREDFKKATTGEIYRTISLTNEFYQDKQLSPDKNYIRLQNEWRVPVVVDGRNRTLLTVFGQDTSLAVVDLGGSGLAEELQSQTSGFEGKEKFIFRIYSLSVDFIVFVDHGKDLSDGEYFPMNSALMRIPGLKRKALTQQNVFHIVKKELDTISKN